MNASIGVALVTGGARRVGRAIVLRLAEAGFDIAFTYRDSTGAAEELAAAIASAGRRMVAVRTDLCDPEPAIEQIASAFGRQFNRLDVLVNNASIYEPSSLQATTIEQMRRFWAIHVEAPLLLSRQFEKLLRESRGHVINMVDLLAERPWPEHLSYCASKAGLWNLTLGLARELAPEVTVNGIAPGVVEWPEGMPESARAQYLKRVPLGRPGSPLDVAEVVHFLCTGGNYMTGQILRLDGGRSLV